MLFPNVKFPKRDDDCPLKKFVDRVENECQFLENKHQPMVKMIPDRDERCHKE